MNAPTTKISSMIEEGMTVNYNSNYIAVAAPSEQPQTDEEGNIYYEFGYSINYHNGMMPAFESEFFETLQDLANAMRKLADLRTWRKAEIDY